MRRSTAELETLLFKGVSCAKKRKEVAHPLLGGSPSTDALAGLILISRNVKTKYPQPPFQTDWGPAQLLLNSVIKSTWLLVEIGPEHGNNHYRSNEERKIGLQNVDKLIYFVL